MKVRATAMGFYGNIRRRPGDVFVLKPYKRMIEEIDEKAKTKTIKEIQVTPEMQFSNEWMEVVSDSAKTSKPRSNRQFGPRFSQDGAIHHEAARPSHAARDEDESSTGDQSVI